jgi:hypothetical protein
VVKKGSGPVIIDFYGTWLVIVRKYRSIRRHREYNGARIYVVHDLLCDRG